jgi:hypothetical protein
MQSADPCQRQAGVAILQYKDCHASSGVPDYARNDILELIINSHFCHNIIVKNIFLWYNSSNKLLSTAHGR